MSLLPPSGYQHEPGPPFGKPCGNSYNRAITVTGALPGLDYGGEYKMPLSALYAGKLADLGFKSKAERELAEDLDGTIDYLRGVITDRDAKYFSDKERASLQWLLNRASAQLDEIGNTYFQWELRQPPWPLGDDDWQTPEGEGANAIEVNLRKQARQQIRSRWESALYHVRCAQYGHARLLLYKKAKAAYESELHGPFQPGFAPGGDGPTKPEIVTLAPGVLDAMDGPVIGELYLPDPDSLPPPDQVPEPPAKPGLTSSSGLPAALSKKYLGIPAWGWGAGIAAVTAALVLKE